MTAEDLRLALDGRVVSAGGIQFRLVVKEILRVDDQRPDPVIARIRFEFGSEVNPVIVDVLRGSRFSHQFSLHKDVDKQVAEFMEFFRYGMTQDLMDLGTDPLKRLALQYFALLCSWETVKAKAKYDRIASSVLGAIGISASISCFWLPWFLGAFAAVISLLAGVVGVQIAYHSYKRTTAVADKLAQFSKAI